MKLLWHIKTLLLSVCVCWTVYKYWVLLCHSGCTQAPTRAGAPLLRRPGGPGLPQDHHIDTELSADTWSTWSAVAQRSWAETILQPQPPGSLDYRCVPPHPARELCLIDGLGFDCRDIIREHAQVTFSDETNCICRADSIHFSWQLFSRRQIRSRHSEDDPYSPGL